MEVPTSANEVPQLVPDSFVTNATRETLFVSVCASGFRMLDSDPGGFQGM